MSYLLKTVGYSVWALAFALSVALAWDFHQGQNHIALGVAVLALIVSASGLLMARYSWQRGDYLVMFLGLGLWLAGAVSFTFTELGFWTSSYNERHAEYMEVKTSKARQEGLTDRAWKALTTGEMPPSPAELEARIKAAQQHERWGPSKGCTEATVTESRTFCNGYFELQAQLAAAEQRQKFEGQILGSEAKPETSYVHDVFALAASLARWLDMDDEQKAAEYIILSTWILLLLARDTGLLIANPLGRHRAAATAAKTEPSFIRPDFSRKPPVEPRLGLGLLLDRPAMEDKPAPLNVPPGGGGVPSVKPKPEITEPSVAVAEQNVIALRPERKPKDKAEKRQGCARTWLEDCTSQTLDKKVKPSSGELYKSYLAWCKIDPDRPMHPLKQKEFTRKIVAVLRMKDKKRNVNGQRLFPGLQVYFPRSAESKRAVA